MPVLGFEVEWYDPNACIVKQLFLKFWTEDNTVELVIISWANKYSSYLMLSS
jgi:hypothetical protein